MDWPFLWSDEPRTQSVKKYSTVFTLRIQIILIHENKSQFGELRREPHRPKLFRLLFAWPPYYISMRHSMVALVQCFFLNVFFHHFFDVRKNRFFFTKPKFFKNTAVDSSWLFLGYAPIILGICFPRLMNKYQKQSIRKTIFVLWY